MAEIAAGLQSGQAEDRLRLAHEETDGAEVPGFYKRVFDVCILIGMSSVDGNFSADTVGADLVESAVKVSGN